jgi:hypothetical protein
MCDGRVDPAKQRRTSGKMKEGAGGGWIWSRLLERTPVEGDQAGGGTTSLCIAMVAWLEPVTYFSAFQVVSHTL